MATIAIYQPSKILKGIHVHLTVVKFTKIRITKLHSCSNCTLFYVSLSLLQLNINSDIIMKWKCNSKLFKSARLLFAIGFQ